MRVLVDGRETDPASVAVHAMNFGQHHRWAGHAAHAYECVLTMEELVGGASAWWERLCRELRDDIPFRTRGDDPELDRLEDLDHPPLSRMTAELREELAAVLLWEPEALLAFLSRRDDRSPLRYVVNSVDDVSVGEEAVRFSGVAFAR